MNRFTVELTTDTQYQNELNKAPVLIVDRITLTSKLLNAQVRTDAPMHLIKDIAAQQLSKKIVDLMNHISVSDLSSNLHYEEFSFTYAEKDELDIMKQQLESRTKQYLSACEDLNKAQEHIAYIMNRYIKSKNYLKITKAIIVLISTLAVANLVVRFM